MMAIKGKRFVTVLHALVKNIGPLHIGTGDNDILIDQTENRAILPATSIAGVFRSYVTEHPELGKVDEMFGLQDKESQIYFYDSLSDQMKIENRPGVRINPVTGAALKGHKLDREYLGANHRFHLKIEIFTKDEEQKWEFTNLIYKCLKALDQQHLSFGGHGSIGAGFFQLVQAEKEEYDLENPHSFSEFLIKKGERIEITDLVQQISLPNDFIEIQLDANLTTPLLIKAVSSNNANLPDAKNIRNSDGRFIIPGSSLKGVLRNQCQRILNYYQKSRLIEIAFGRDTNDYEQRTRGRVFVDDSVIEQGGNEEGIYNRIKIDRFTGGVHSGALMTEEPVQGKISIKIRYKLLNEPYLDDAIIGVLLLSVRDIAIGNVAIGSGNNVGRGRLSGWPIMIRNGKDGSLNQYIQALVEWEDSHVN